MTTLIPTACSMKVCRSYYIQNCTSFSLSLSLLHSIIFGAFLDSMEAVKLQVMEGETLDIIQAPKKKQCIYGNKDTSKLAFMFQQGMENISSMLPQSFYGVERAQGQ